MEWLSQIHQLRKQIPVGIKSAHKLLQQSCGDIAEAIALFNAAQINVLVRKTNITYEKAAQILQQTGYDLPRSFKYIEQERYTLTELILRKCADPGEAVWKITLAIEFEWRLTRKYWLHMTDLERLPSELCCFMLIHEWQNYAEWEGFPAALFFEIESVLQQLQRLGLLNLAVTVADARKRYDELLVRFPKRAHNMIIHDVSFKKLEEQYNQQQNEIYDALLVLAKKHLDLFPHHHRQPDATKTDE